MAAETLQKNKIREALDNSKKFGKTGLYQIQKG
jgi:hypothetical protein